MKYSFVKVFLICIMFTFTFQVCGCKSNAENTTEKINSTASSSQKDVNFVMSKDDENISNSIEVYVNKFNEAIEMQSSSALNQIVSKEGFVLLRTFTSGFGTRGAEVFELIDPSKISTNLVFSIVKEETPISLKTEFQSENKEFSKMKIVNTNEDIKCETFIKTEILNTFGKIIEIEKEIGEETRVYILKDGNFCLAQFAGSGLQYSRWVVFEKTGKGYDLKIIAIVN